MDTSRLLEEEDYQKLQSLLEPNISQVMLREKLELLEEPVRLLLNKN